MVYLQIIHKQHLGIYLLLLLIISYDIDAAATVMLIEQVGCVRHEVTKCFSIPHLSQMLQFVINNLR